MQFRIFHLLFVISGLAGILAIREMGNVDIFRQMLTIFSTLVLAWLFSSLAFLRFPVWSWVFGAAGGILAASAVAAVTMLTWPWWVDCDLNGDPFMPFGFYLREVVLFVVACPFIGAAVGGWQIVSRRSELQKRFSVPIGFSKLVLSAAILFRLLSLVGEMRPDWETLSLFGILVFSVHTLNWMPRLLRANDIQGEVA